MKKALVFDPYIDTLGGGERYILSFCLGLKKYGYDVHLAWKEERDIKIAEERFGLNLTGINLDTTAYKLCHSKSNLIERFGLTKGYDLVFWISDGSLPFLFSKKNLVHFQVPFTKLGGNFILNQIKSLFIHRFIYNSKFTRNVVEKSLPKAKGTVLYPPIDTSQFKPGKKENIILSVARFDSPSHAKRQDILIQAFKKLNHSIKSNYKLILTGGLKGDNSLLDRYQNMAKGFQIEIVTNLEFIELKSLYAKSKIFWHAAGYEIDETKEPEKVEHFGMTTVEAMAAGCVPIVIDKGGQKEIITTNTGFLCRSMKEMVASTQNLIDSPEILAEMSKKAAARANTFSLEEFGQEVINILKN